MKKLLILSITLTAICSAQGQTIKGSIRPGNATNKIEVMFLPNYNPTATEYVNYLSISIAIPTANATGVTASISTAGTIFSNINLVPALPASYTQGNEKIFSWIANNLNNTPMNWTSGNPFVGATITLTGIAAGVPVRMVDFSNLEGGGTNGNTFFLVVTNVRDATDYSSNPAFFYSIPGTSTTGQYPNQDWYVQTTTASVPTPVTLTNFSGYRDGNRNQLKWTTVAEWNNLGFYLERSTDGRSFSSIGFISSQAPNGNSNSRLDYSFTDNNLIGNVHYYRLRQVDIDGKEKLSQVVILRDNRFVFSISKLFPNPVHDVVNAQVESPGRDNVTVLVTDLAGKEVKRMPVTLEKGTNTVALNVTGLANGTYIIRMVSEVTGKIQTAQFVKY